METPLQIPPKRHALLIFFGLVFALSWSLWIPAALAQAGLLAIPVPTALLDLVGAWAPSLIAILLTLAMDKRQGLSVLLRRLLVWRVGLRWFLFVLFFPAVLSLLTTGIAMLLGRPAPDFSHPLFLSVYPIPPEARAYGFLVFLPMAFIIQVFSSSLGEELGWRGFALPRLQSRRSALLSAVIIGIIWGVWHLPRLWTPGQSFDYANFAWFLIGITLDSILYTWIFNNTRGSLVPAVLFHTTQNITSMFLASVDAPALSVLITFILVLVIVAREGATHLTRQPTALLRDAQAGEIEAE
jgi:membrane protease YdiL (CAAX protease family)